MKNLKSAAAIISLVITLIFSASAILNAEAVYGAKNTLELNGSISISYTAETDASRTSIVTGPGIHYFPVDSFHLGLRPFLDYRIVYTRDTEEYTTSASFTPVLQAGYVFRLSDNLFFDLAPEIGYSIDYPLSADDEVNYRYMYYGLITALKVQAGNALIDIYIQQTIKDHISDEGPDGYYQVSLGLGFSVFFNM